MIDVVSWTREPYRILVQSPTNHACKQANRIKFQTIKCGAYTQALFVNEKFGPKVSNINYGLNCAEDDKTNAN